MYIITENVLYLSKEKVWQVEDSGTFCMRIEQGRNSNFANPLSCGLLWLWPLQCFEGHVTSVPEGGWLRSRVVWRIAGELPWKYRAVHITHITTALVPEILRGVCVASVHSCWRFSGIILLMSIVTLIYIFFLRQVRKRESNPHFFCHLLKSTLSMATPVSMVHAVLPFREALLRDTYTRTHCHVNVVAFYSTLKESYSEL